MRTEQIIASALKQTDNDRYKLSIAVAKRVKQIQNGAQVLIDANLKKEELSDIALREIAEGLVTINEE